MAVLMDISGLVCVLAAEEDEMIMGVSEPADGGVEGSGAIICIKKKSINCSRQRSSDTMK